MKKGKENGAKHFLHCFQRQHRLSHLEIADYKELFLLYDKDQDGILSFMQLCLAIRTLGIRMKGEEE
jgi:Ca2+-binding EF-hand superfamily protein